MSLHDRGTPYYKNYKTTNRNDGGAAMTIGNATIAALYNPFTIKTTVPKWPDGLATYSIGNRRPDAVVLGDFTATASDGTVLCPNEAKAKEWLIWLNPSLTNFCVIFWRAQAGEIASFDQLMTGLPVTKTTGDKNITTFNIDESGINSWRPVSYALKIIPVAAAYETDGRFECIRTSRNGYYDKIALVETEDDADSGVQVDPPEGPIVGNGMHLPSDELLNDWFSTKDWLSNPSYSSGNVSNLKDLMFQLNNEKKVNDFIRMDRIWYDKNNVEKTSKGNGINFVFPIDGATKVADKDASSNSPSFDEGPFMANSMDSILIKINTKQTARFIFHGIANLESLLREENSGFGLASPSYQATQALERYLDNRNKYHKLPFHTLRHNNIQYENDDYN